MNNLDCANDTSETFFLLSSAYNPASFKNICGRPTWTPVEVVDANTVPTQTPDTDCTAASVTDFKSEEIADTRLNLGALDVAGKLTINISSTLSEPNVLPAQVKILDPLILTLSPSPRFLINFGNNTKSPEKSAPDMNVSSWWTDIISSRPFFTTSLIDLVNESSPFILTCSPSINVPDTCSKSKLVKPPPAFFVNPVAPLLNPSTKEPTGNSELDNDTLKSKFVYNWISYK